MGNFAIRLKKMDQSSNGLKHFKKTQIIRHEMQMQKLFEPNRSSPIDSGEVRREYYLFSDVLFFTVSINM